MIAVLFTLIATLLLAAFVAMMQVGVTCLTPAERDAFVKATRPVYGKWKPTVGADLVTKAEPAIAARRKQWRQ